jgi:hypothetical protein
MRASCAVNRFAHTNSCVTHERERSNQCTQRPARAVAQSHLFCGRGGGTCETTHLCERTRAFCITRIFFVHYYTQTHVAAFLGGRGEKSAKPLSARTIIIE